MVLQIASSLRRVLTAFCGVGAAFVGLYGLQLLTAKLDEAIPAVFLGILGFAVLIGLAALAVSAVHERDRQQRIAERRRARYRAWREALSDERRNIHREIDRQLRQHRWLVAGRRTLSATRRLR